MTLTLLQRLYVSDNVQADHKIWVRDKEKEMVDRTDSKGFDEFEGEVANVELVPSGLKDKPESKQYKISISTIPSDLTKGIGVPSGRPSGETGMMYTWVGIPATATETSVPNGSVIEAYIRALERLDSSLKKAEKVADLFNWMKGKKFQFNKETLGKAYGGHDPAVYWVPVRVIQ